MYDHQVSSKGQRRRTFGTRMGPLLENATAPTQWIQTHVIPCIVYHRTLEDASDFRGALSPQGDQWPGPDVAPEDVRDICDLVSRHDRASKDLQLFVSAGNSLKAFATVLHATATVDSKQSKTSSLDALLNKDEAQRLDLTSRLIISLALASTVLQLCGTGWILDGPLGRQVLLQQCTPSMDDSPFPSVQAADAYFTVTSPRQSCIRVMSLKRSLLELGIVLLELWHDKTMEAYFKGRLTGGTTDFYDRMSLAHRWADETQRYMLPNHHKAVRACIRCLSQDADLIDKSLRDEIATDVLLPLMEILNYTV